MIVLTCECGEVFRADEKHIGYSIRCNNCQRIIPVTSKSEASTIAAREEPAIDTIPPETMHGWAPKDPLKPEHSSLRNRVLPLIGILALAVGLTLTVISLRGRKGEAPASQSLTPSGSAVPTNTANVSVVGTHPTPSISTKLQSATPDSSRSTSPERTSDSDPLGMDQFLANNSRNTPTLPPETIRYPTGTNLIRPRNMNGRGVLKISNGTNYDAIAKLADAETNITVRLVYIQANSNDEITSIGAGDYILKFALGTGYDKARERFLYAQSFAKFVDILDFREYTMDEEIRWHNFDVSLNPVLGGTARTSTISAAEFYDH